MKAQSPFAASRFEYEARHVYYLPKEAFAELEDAKPTYLIGSRGTGKTTLLKALNWDERLNNPTLRKQLEGDAFSGRYIGVYLKAPEYQLEEFDLWLKDASPQLYGTIVGFFFDLISIGLIAAAIAELSIRGILEITPEAEHATVGHLIEEMADVLWPLFPERPPFTVRDLARACTKGASELQTKAKERPDPMRLMDRLPVGQAGSFGRRAAVILGNLCDSLAPDEQSWHFKVCIDEAETLKSLQQIAINTMVRLAVWPLFPVLSFVSLPTDLTATLSHRLTLQKADRHLRVLDDMTDKQFRELAEGVATVRVRHSLKRLKCSETEFSADRILGAGMSIYFWSQCSSHRLSEVPPT